MIDLTELQRMFSALEMFLSIPWLILVSNLLFDLLGV